MQTLIQDLLMLARVTSHAGPFHSRNLQEVVLRRSSSIWKWRSSKRGHVEVGPLPEIQADATQMRQLFQNLISNALKFQRPGERPRVVISSKMLNEFDPFRGGSTSERPLCEIRVQDNGIGFDEKFADQIFVLFQRLHGRAEYDGPESASPSAEKLLIGTEGRIVAQARLVRARRLL